MKKTNLLALLLLIPFGIIAQNTFPTNGNIGIGTTSPISLLDVDGDGKIGSLNNRHYLRIASKEWPEIRFQTPSSDRQIRLGTAHANNGRYGVSEGDFYVYTATSNTMPLVVNKNGNVSLVNKSGSVGIGTTSPISLLDVDGDGKIGSLNNRHYLRIASKEWPEIRFQTPSSDRQIRLGTAHANNGRYGVSEGDFYVYTATSNTMPLVVNKNGNVSLVNKSGSVGIGTTNPKSKLHISGGSADWNETIQGQSIGSIHLDPENGTNNFGNAITFGASDAYSGENAQAGIYVRSDGTYGTKMYFSTSNSYAEGSKTAMSIDHNGNVGIGITNPDSKLSVNGKIHTKEVKVDLIGWSDFVFKNDYELPTLKDVEKYINEKGHLKDIPSAEEVEKNGINLGEMDAKLLQKIEELTLYTIAQEKKIEKVERQNESLKVMNSKLIELQKRLEKLEKK